AEHRGHLAGRRGRERRPPRLGLRAALRLRPRLSRVPDPRRAHAVSIDTDERRERRALDKHKQAFIKYCGSSLSSRLLLAGTKRRDYSCPVVWFVFDGWATSEMARGGTPFFWLPPALVLIGVVAVGCDKRSAVAPCPTCGR